MNDTKASTSNKAQVQANITQNEKRKGGISFSAIRFDPADELNLNTINATIKAFGSTRKDAVVAAFKLLQERLDTEKKK